MNNIPRIPAPLDRDALAAKAIELHNRNFNCAQSVACTFAPLLGADEDLCFRLSEGLGGGLGGHTETCGALLGGAMALGLVRSNGAADPTSKQDTYALVKDLAARFHDAYGTTVCQDIRAQDPSTVTPLPICGRCIEDAVRLTADIIEGLA